MIVYDFKTDQRWNELLNNCGKSGDKDVFLEMHNQKKINKFVSFMKDKIKTQVQIEKN